MSLKIASKDLGCQGNSGSGAHNERRRSRRSSGCRAVGHHTPRKRGVVGRDVQGYGHLVHVDARALDRNKVLLSAWNGANDVCGGCVACLAVISVDGAGEVGSSAAGQADAANGAAFLAGKACASRRLHLPAPCGPR